MSPRLRNMLLSSALMLAAVVLVGRLDSEGAIPSHLPLASFPDRIGNWTGVRLPMDKKTRSLLNADGYASVLYTDRPGDPGLLFFSVYYDRQTAEKISTPRPTVFPRPDGRSFLTKSSPFPSTAGGFLRST